MGECAEMLIEGQIEGWLDEDGCYLGEDEYKEQKRLKKQRNYDFGIKKLQDENISFKKSGPHHIILKDWDFWPSTGKFISRQNKKIKGRGIFNLIKKIKGNLKK